MTLGIGLIFGSVICFAAAVFAVAFDVSDPKVYLIAMALGGGLGFPGVKFA